MREKKENIFLPRTSKATVWAQYLLNKRYVQIFEELLHSGALPFVASKNMLFNYSFVDNKNIIQNGNFLLKHMDNVFIEKDKTSKLSESFFSLSVTDKSSSSWTNREELSSCPHLFHVINPLMEFIKDGHRELIDSFSPEFLEKIKFNKKNLMPIKLMLETMLLSGANASEDKYFIGVVHEKFIDTAFKEAQYHGKTIGADIRISTDLKQSPKINFADTLTPTSDIFASRTNINETIESVYSTDVRALVHTIDCLLEGSTEDIIRKCQPNRLKMLSRILLAKELNKLIYTTIYSEEAVKKSKHGIEKPNLLRAAIRGGAQELLIKIKNSTPETASARSFGESLLGTIEVKTDKQSIPLYIKSRASCSRSPKSTEINELKFLDLNIIPAIFSAIAKDLAIAPKQTPNCKDIISDLTYDFKSKGYNGGFDSSYNVAGFLQLIKHVSVSKGQECLSAYPIEQISKQIVGEMEKNHSQKGEAENKEMLKAKASIGVKKLLAILSEFDSLFNDISENEGTKQNVFSFIKKNGFNTISFYSEPNQPSYSDKDKLKYDVLDNSLLYITKERQGKNVSNVQYKITVESLKELLEELQSDKEISNINNGSRSGNKLRNFFIFNRLPFEEWNRDVENHKNNMEQAKNFTSIEVACLEYLATEFSEEVLELNAIEGGSLNF